MLTISCPIPLESSFMAPLNLSHDTCTPSCYNSSHCLTALALLFVCSIYIFLIKNGVFAGLKWCFGLSYKEGYIWCISEQVVLKRKLIWHDLTSKWYFSLSHNILCSNLQQSHMIYDMMPRTSTCSGDKQLRLITSMSNLNVVIMLRKHCGNYSKGPFYKSRLK